MRYLGLDLGTTSLGIAITDKTNTLATPYEVIKFPKEQYDVAIEKLKPIIIEKNITDIVLGLPKNMDNTLGFAAQRSLDFGELLKELKVEIHFFDERLSTVEALNIIKSTGIKNIKEKNIVDAISASIILESYMKGLK